MSQNPTAHRNPMPVNPHPETAAETIERNASAIADHIEKLCDRLTRLDARLHGDKPQPVPSGPGAPTTGHPGGIAGAVIAHLDRATHLVSRAHVLVDDLERFA